ncbi:NTP transferase domain-containing protein [Frankia sp. Cppng1_Ct_nod]|uniref:molybdenum cofactor guanylyltransferase n=1 Tax=Frankia sp. Cppng1_Ct_nod TaxID=2897162 RepID=UPI0010412A28|nr:NTP transferase domain-containing protein [Frankia sp. Cppng1_Ct_nod]
MSWDAVVLAGGSARRLGGVDKPRVTIGGRTLLERVLAAVDDARGIIVVGPPRPVPGPRPIIWTREHPLGGGPVAALAAGLELVRAPLVAVLAADLPFLAAETVGALVRAAGGGDDGSDVDGGGDDGSADRAAHGDAPQGALLVDPPGRHQYLAGVWRTGALRGQLPAVTYGVPLRDVLSGLRTVVLPVDARTALDCDEPADVERARQWAETPGSEMPGSGAPTGRSQARMDG